MIAFTCPRCGWTSFNCHDARERYCGHCHVFVDDEAILHLKQALTEDHDEPLAWRLLAQAYDAKHMPGQARLAEAEYNYSIGDFNDAKAFAMRAREFLPQNTPDWRRATDIVLVSKPTDTDLRMLAQHGDGS